MNTELILTVLSLLGDIPLPMHTQAPPEALTAIYAEWVNTGTVTVACPDPDSALDPMGTPAVVSHTTKDKDGSTTSVAVPVLLVPASGTCTRAFKDPHHSIFPSTLDAGEFRLHCPEGQCLDWHARAATDEEVVDYALTKRHWQIDHYPGGDPSKFPHGIFEVYPRDERKFDEPIGQGSTALQAIAVALQKGGE